MLRKLFTLFLFCTLFSISLQAQRNSNRWTDEWDDVWEWDNDLKPMIELNYGFSKAKNNNLEGTLPDVGLAEIKLGYSTKDFYNDYIIELKDKYLFASKIGSKLMTDYSTATDLNFDLYRMGVGRRKGLGYKFGAVAIIPYLQDAFVWTKLQDLSDRFYPQSPWKEKRDEKVINRYKDNIRFGTLAEGGIKFDVASFVSLNAGYETAVIFPRHLFWKHAGSFMLEQAGLMSLDYFVDEIVENSPAAGPIFNFLLKGGYRYAFYLLKKEDMNWPFKTEAPLTFETVKFGVTFTF